MRNEAMRCAHLSLLFALSVLLVRRAVICAHRLVWLLGCVAFLNDHSACLWGHMHSTLHQIYAPNFRRKYLTKFVGLNNEQADEVMKRDAKLHSAAN